MYTQKISQDEFKIYKFIQAKKEYYDFRGKYLYLMF